MKTILFIFIYLFIGLMIQLVGKIFFIKPGDETNTLNAMDYVLTGQVGDYSEDAAQKIWYGKIFTLINVVGWPINVGFGLFILWKIHKITKK